MNRHMAALATNSGLKMIERLFNATIAIVAFFGVAADPSSNFNPLYQLAYLTICALAVVSTIARPGGHSRLRANAIAAAWLSLAVMALGDFIMPGGSITALVRACEAMTIGAASFSLAREGRRNSRHLILAAVASLMLILFGWVHLTLIEAIAELVPAWFPGRAHVPLFTGSIMIAAGLGLWPHSTRVFSAILVAGLFLSWLPLVHAGRLAANPADTSEWLFAAMDATLSLSLIILSMKELRWRRPGHFDEELGKPTSGLREAAPGLERQ